MSNIQSGQPDTDSVGGLVSDMSAQVSRLVRDELQLAQADLQQKGKKAGAGAGLFGGAAVLGLYALRLLHHGGHPGAGAFHGRLARGPDRGGRARRGGGYPGAGGPRAGQEAVPPVPTGRSPD